MSYASLSFMLHKTEKKGGINRQKDQLVNKISNTITYMYLHRYTNKLKKYLTKTKSTIHNFNKPCQITFFRGVILRQKGETHLIITIKEKKIKKFFERTNYCINESKMSTSLYKIQNGQPDWHAIALSSLGFELFILCRFLFIFTDSSSFFNMKSSGFVTQYTRTASLIQVPINCRIDL